MNVSGVCAGEEKALAKLRAFQDRVIDGHAPGLVGKDLQILYLFQEKNFRINQQWLWS